LRSPIGREEERERLPREEAIVGLDVRRLRREQEPHRDHPDHEPRLGDAAADREQHEPAMPTAHSAYAAGGVRTTQFASGRRPKAITRSSDAYAS
jgi:hypothetical protein